MDDLLSHLFLGSVVFVFLRQDHGESTCHASRNNGNLVHRIGLRQAVGNDCMTSFVISSQLTFFVTDDSALLLRTGDDLGDGLFDLFHPDDHAVSAGCEQRRFIEHVLDVGRRESRRPSGENLRVNAFIQRLVAGVDLEDLLSSNDIRNADDDLSVETARPQKRRIEYVRSVGCSQNDDARILRESIHLNEQLVERLLSFIVTAAEACASASSDSVDLVDEHDARRVLLGLIEEVSDS